MQDSPHRTLKKSSLLLGILLRSDYIAAFSFLKFSSGYPILSLRKQVFLFLFVFYLHKSMLTKFVNLNFILKLYILIHVFVCFLN